MKISHVNYLFRIIPRDFTTGTSFRQSITTTRTLSSRRRRDYNTRSYYSLTDRYIKRQLVSSKTDHAVKPLELSQYLGTTSAFLSSSEMSVAIPNN